MMQTWYLVVVLEKCGLIHLSALTLSVNNSYSSTTMAFDRYYIRHLTDCQTLLSIRYIE